MSNYSKFNIVYLLQKWMDSVPGQTFLNYAYSWGASIVILGTLFKLTHLPGANVMLFLGMGTEVIVFFISAFDRPFDKSTIDMTLDNHMEDEIANNQSTAASIPGGTIIIGNGIPSVPSEAPTTAAAPEQTGSGIHFDNENVYVPTMANPVAATTEHVAATTEHVAATTEHVAEATAPAAVTTVTTPAPAVSQETAEAMEAVTTSYIDHLNELNEMLEKVAAQSARLSTDSEEMENLNRTLTGISRVYEMQLKSASQQITTQDSINEQTARMADQIKELNAIYARMIEAMTVNMPGAQPKA